MQKQLLINKEYKSYVPRPEKEDFKKLKESLEQHGFYPEFPIIINEENQILDGYTRYQICQELNIEPTIQIKKFADKYEEAEFVIDVNLKRRHLTIPQRVELGMKIEDLEKERAKKRQMEAGQYGKEGGRGHRIKDEIDFVANPMGNSSPEGLDGNTDRTTKRVADKIGVSRKTYERGRIVFKEASQEVQEKVRAGKETITHAYMTLKKEERQSSTPDLPKDLFNVIMADPPWEYEIELRGTPSNHYSTQETEKIKELKIPASANAILFLWATNPKIEAALEVMKAWGFEYKTNLVWIKERIGNGYYVRGQHELLLLGIKGKMETPLEKNRPSSIINAKSTTHSTKPDITYEIIEKMYPNQKYLELFARNKRAGWTSWGNEVS